MPESVWGSNPWGVTPANWWVAPGGGIDSADDETYQRFLLGQGVGGNQTPREKWYRDQYNRQLTNYGQHNLTGGGGVGYRFMDFLRDYGGGMADQFASLSPNQRGERLPPWQRLRWLS